MLDRYISRENNDNIQIWSINTTLAKDIGQTKSEELKGEISNWKLYESFWTKYGLIIDRPIRFINLYFLTSLKSKGRLFCLPDARPGTNLIIDQFDNKFDSYWIYERELQYDPDFNFTVINTGFRTWIHSPVVEVKSFVQLAHLLHSGFGDWSSLENYFVLQDHDIKNLIDILNSNVKPSLIDLLNTVDYFCMDFKGEDQGYGSLFEIYSTKNNHMFIEELISNFYKFKLEVDNLLRNAKSIIELENNLLNLMKAYGC